MSAPRRIQRRRTKGWRMPEGAVYVGRPGKWGNPYRVGSDVPFKWAPNAATSVQWFRRRLRNNPNLVAAIRSELAGKDLACWCSEDAEHCHADVLLEVANGGTP